MIMTAITACADIASFAFVEYESRRDADDAYHEMHNKRIGRDDLLKIEVCPEETQEGTRQGWQRRLISFSGLELPRLLRGDSTRAAIVLGTPAKVATAAANVLLQEEVHAPHLLAAATTRLAKTIAVTATRIVETDRAAPRTVIVR